MDLPGSGSVSDGIGDINEIRSHVICAMAQHGIRRKMGGSAANSDGFCWLSMAPSSKINVCIRCRKPRAHHGISVTDASPAARAILNHQFTNLGHITGDSSTLRPLTNQTINKNSLKNPPRLPRCEDPRLPLLFEPFALTPLMIHGCTRWQVNGRVALETPNQVTVSKQPPLFPLRRLAFHSRPGLFFTNHEDRNTAAKCQPNKIPCRISPHFSPFLSCRAG